MSSLVTPDAGEARVRAILDTLVAAVRVVVAADERAALLDETCRTLLGHGAFEMAWIGADEDGDGWIERLAVAGDTTGYTDGIRISTRDIPEGQGPTATAVRTGRPDVCVDAATDERMAIWRDRYLSSGFRSSAAFPLHSNSLPTAVLTVYTNVAGTFETDEVAVLADLAGAIGFALDTISDRRRAASSIRASAAAMRASLDSMIDPFMICSSVRDDQGAITDFRIDFANPAVREFLNQDTLVGSLVPRKTVKLRDRWFRDAARDVVERREAWAEERVAFMLPGGDGDDIRGEANIQIVPFGDGFFAAWRDVTERERTLAALMASELHARELVEDSADGILISGSDGRYVEANPAMCRMLGYSREELLTMHAGDLTADDDPVGNVGMRKRLAEPAGEAGILTERRYRHRDGTSVPVEVRFTMLSRGRQQRNVRNITERLAAEADEAREARIRTALTEALQHIADDATVEEAGQAICNVLSTLPGVDFTSIDAFLGEGEVTVLAGTLPAAFPTHPGDALPAERARYLQACAASGPWADYGQQPGAFGPLGDEFAQAGLRAAVFGPIVHGDHVDGLLVIGTADEAFTRTLVERMPGLAAFTATSSGLLAEGLHARRLETELRTSLTSVIRATAYHPVFQSIVDLESGEVVGYEALSRFDSGQPPDRCFADAWSVGLGPDLEFATIEAAVVASKVLPSGRWLDVNVSPRLLTDPDRLRTLLRRAERPIVIEITEHEAISDYGSIREVIHGLGNDVRLAVDDAGAGIANFGHIVELRPDLVKLDISLVRGVNANLGRQAMVVGMRHFSRTAGCRLVAEGVETEAEATTLRGLGVEFGQGYLFGRPEPVETWAAAEAKS